MGSVSIPCLLYSMPKQNKVAKSFVKFNFLQDLQLERQTNFDQVQKKIIPTIEEINKNFLLIFLFISFSLFSQYFFFFLFMRVIQSRTFYTNFFCYGVPALPDTHNQKKRNPLKNITKKSFQ